MEPAFPRLFFGGEVAGGVLGEFFSPPLGEPQADKKSTIENRHIPFTEFFKSVKFILASGGGCYVVLHEKLTEHDTQCSRRACDKHN